MLIGNKSYHNINDKELKLILSSFFIVFLFLHDINAQDNPIIPYGNITVAYLGNTDNASGLGNNGNTSADFIGIRIRYGINYQINENSIFAARLATQLRDDTDQLRITLQADGNGISPGTISFDELYYQYKNERTTLKLGRFQHSLQVLSNSTRNGMRFQSLIIFVHWSDGIYVKRDLNNEWYAEIIGEYQPRKATTYPYQGALNFGNTKHNVTTYTGIENRTRDRFNFIQKGIGIFVAPNAFQKNGEYSNYVALTSRLVLDLPEHDFLKGGTYRIAGELNQNINTKFSEGTNAIISAGINRFGGKHDLMLEFSRTDTDWLLATSYAPNNDELELRYRVFPADKIWFDIRYRIRVNDNPNVPYAYSTFIRLNYSI